MCYYLYFYIEEISDYYIHSEECRDAATQCQNTQDWKIYVSCPLFFQGVSLVLVGPILTGKLNQPKYYFEFLYFKKDSR